MSTREQVAELYHQLGGNVTHIANALGLARSTITYHLRKLDLREEPSFDGRVQAEAASRRPLPGQGEVRRYILSSAQNNSRVHEPVFKSLLLLASHLGAELMISRFTYNKSAYGLKSIKPGSRPDLDNLWYDSVIEPYLSDERVELAPGLVWCGEMNIIPTASRPLSGFETYTGRKSGIFPHAKLALESIASGKFESTKFNFTTGTVTQRNYIQRKAGLRADFHHSYGGLLVEINEHGDWYCRQLCATEDGEIYDLDLRVADGVVSTGHRVEAITWGDVHAAQIDPVVRDIAWGPLGMIDVLRPRYQFMHDLFDMRARNHHDRGNPHKMFERFITGMDSVEDEVTRTSQFLHWASRDWCRTVVVNSNHDNALERWLREADYKTDPRNALFFLEAQLEK